MNSMKIKQKK